MALLLDAADVRETDAGNVQGGDIDILKSVAGD